MTDGGLGFFFLSTLASGTVFYCSKFGVNLLTEVSSKGFENLLVLEAKLMLFFN